MKAFEKWFNENKVDWPYYPHDIMDCNLAWKAALEWIQSRFEFGSNVAYSTDDILIGVKKEIREELESE